MAGDAAEAFLADHLVARVLGFLNVADRREHRLLEFVYLAEERDQRADVGLAELRHHSLNVGARALALQEGAFESGRRQLGADVRERRREASLVAERGRRAGEERVAFGGDAAEPTAFMASEAVEAGQLGVQGLFRIQRFRPA